MRPATDLERALIQQLRYAAGKAPCWRSYIEANVRAALEVHGVEDVR